MPTNITGSMIVDKDGNKQSVLNFSNARRKTYAQWQEMTDEQKKGAVIVKDYPTTNLIPSDIVGYGNGTVEDELDRMNLNSMSSASAVTVNAATNYTAPSDGYIRFAGTVDKTVLLSVNNIPLIQSTPEASTGASRLYSLYVRKGMVIKMTNNSATFYPIEAASS